MWYVIQVKTGEEVYISSELKARGIKTLVPRENRPIRRGGNWIREIYVFFPGYVFLDLVYNAETYYQVKKVPGVIRFLGDSGMPSRLSHLEAEWISLLSGGRDMPVEPSVICLEDGKPKSVKGVLERFTNRVIRYDLRQRKAIFEITVCNAKKEVRLSFEPEQDAGEDAGQDMTEDPAEQILQEAT